MKVKLTRERNTHHTIIYEGTMDEGDETVAREVADALADELADDDVEAGVIEYKLTVSP